MLNNNELDLNKLDELENQLKPINDIQPNKKRRSAIEKYMSDNQKENKRERKVKPVSFAISFELDGQIDRYCKRHHMKKSTFAAIALEHYLKQKLEEESKAGY
jgi:hypothetical protein